MTTDRYCLDANIEEKIKKVQDEVHRLTDRICYFQPCTDVEEIELYIPEDNKLCCTIAQSEHGHSLCLKKRRNSALLAARRKSSIALVCHCGLGEITTPVYYEKKLIGFFIMFVPFLTEDMQYLSEQSVYFYDNYKVSPEQFNEFLYSNVPISHSKIKPTAELLGALVSLTFENPISTTQRMGYRYDFVEYYIADGQKEKDKHKEENDEFKCYLLPFGNITKNINYIEDDLDVINQIITNDIKRMQYCMMRCQVVEAREVYNHLLENIIDDETELDIAIYNVLFFIYTIASQMSTKQFNYHGINSVSQVAIKRTCTAKTINELKTISMDFFDALYQVRYINATSRNPLAERMVDYIEKNYSKQISLAEIAEQMHTSIGYASRIFKKYAGTNFKSYLINIRMYYASHYLCITDLPINKIAEMCGYENIRAFYTMFDKYYGVSCTRMRSLININKSSALKQYALKQ